MPPTTPSPVPIASTPPQATPQAQPNTTAPDKWPGGWFIVKRSIVDFFTNIVPWLIGLLAVVPLIIAITLLATHHANGSSNGAVIGLGVIGVVALIYVGLCWLGSTPVYGLARADGRKMTTREVYTLRGSIIWRLTLANLVLLIPVVIGFALLIVPGIILLIWLMPAIVLMPYVIVEDNLGPINSIKEAYRLGQKHRWEMWGIIGWYFVLSLLLLIPIVIIVVAILHNANVHPVSNSTSSSTSTSHSSSSGFGGGALSSISFAYLYRWIKQQETPISTPSASAPVGPVAPVV